MRNGRYIYVVATNSEPGYSPGKEAEIWAAVFFRMSDHDLLFVYGRTFVFEAL